MVQGFTPISTRGAHRLADYWALPEGAPYELLGGELVMSPAPKTRHQIIVGEIYLNARGFEAAGGGLALASPIDVVLSDDTVLQPDVIYICQARRHIIGDCVSGPPDLVIEVLSEGHERRDTVEKLALYARFGVPEYWIIDPRTETIQFLILDSGRYVHHTGLDNQYQSPRLSEVRIDLAQFWREIRRRLP
ncbi:MAG: Uma2 family endonuclease [Pirellulales bacterium]|nr:Uma2 family endonuclease [Pirellulales bacterium]